jgi:hypothetical protein
MDSIFNDSKYTKTYFKLIHNSLNRPLPIDYFEMHHIVPKSLGGNDDKSNLVALTAREHFIAHILLTKMLIGPSKYKMVRALVRMAKTGGTSATYALARKIISANSKGNNNPAYGRRWWHDPISHQTAYLLPSQTAPEHYVIGLPCQKGGVEKGRIIINDGRNETFILRDDVIPQGWRKGRLYVASEKQLKNAAQARHTKVKDQEHSMKMRGKIGIFDGNSYKKVSSEKVAEYLQKGWIVKGQPNKSCRPVIVEGNLFESYPLAGKAYGVTPTVVKYRVESEHQRWADWVFA